jgi:hypothetical protein
MGEADSSLVYSAALDHQVRLIRALLGQEGASMVAEDLWGHMGSQLASAGFTSARTARMAGEALREASPFFWAGHIARAIREAVRTMPTYTFTAESFPCPWGFAWFDDPVHLVDDESGPQLLRALHWQIRPADTDGRVPVGLNGFLTRPDSRLQFGIRAMIYLGETIEEALVNHGQKLAIVTTTITGRAPGEDRDEAYLRFFAGCLSFLEQRITTSEQRPTYRGLRRQLARERVPVFREIPEVRVIQLRRRDQEHDARDVSAGSQDLPGSISGLSRVTGAGSTTRLQTLTSRATSLHTSRGHPTNR